MRVKGDAPILGVFPCVAGTRWVKQYRSHRLTRDQELNNYETGNQLAPGVWTLDDVKKYGQEKGVCPYFAIRRMVRCIAGRPS